MTQSSFAWDLPRNLTIKCSLFCTKFIQKNLYLAENYFYKKPLFLRETARGPAVIGTLWNTTKYGKVPDQTLQSRTSIAPTPMACSP